MHQLQLKTVQHLRELPTVEPEDIGEVKRPYRLWNTLDRNMVQWAYFKNLRHAHMRALCEAAWAKGDAVLEVFDIRTGALRGQYKRHGQDIKFWRSSHPLEEH